MKTPDTIQRLADLFAVPNDTIREFLMWHDGEMHEYGKVLQSKILDLELDKRTWESILKKDVEEIQDLKDQLEDAWDKIHALEDDLFNSEHKNTLLAQKLNDLSK